jgi:hypothetical protein
MHSRRARCEIRRRRTVEIDADYLEQAIGVIPGPEGGVTLLVKKSDKHHQPATSTQTTTFGPQRSTRKYVFLDPLPCKRSNHGAMPRTPTNTTQDLHCHRQLHHQAQLPPRPPPGRRCPRLGHPQEPARRQGRQAHQAQGRQGREGRCLRIDVCMEKIRDGVNFITVQFGSHD